MADIRIVIRTIDEAKAGIATINKEMDNLAKSSKEGDAGLKGLNTSLKTIQTSMVAVAAAGLTFKKAFDLAKEGAAINQVKESFDRMNASVYQTPDLLNQMRDAVRGTISDTDLMRGLLTLTAGTTQEMGQAFADASPQLLEIAKAANKLNPTLGDTSFLYQSLSLGIKRSSPLILDNLGLTIKLGDANQAMADQLGKSVEELTAEEKQMALLNATLEAGDRLITQVGGSTESATDSFARLEVQVKSLETQFKTWLADGLTPVIKVLGNDYSNIVARTVEENINVARSMDDLVTAGQQLTESYGVLGGMGARLTGTQDDIRAGIQETGRAIASQSPTFEAYLANIEQAFGPAAQDIVYNYAVAVSGSEEAFYEYARAVAVAESFDKVFTKTLVDSNRILEERREALEGVAQAAYEASPAFAELQEKQQQLGYEFVTTESTIAAANRSTELLTESQREAAKAAEEQAQRLRELQAATGDYFVAALEAEKGAGFFTEALTELGEASYYVSDLTGDQKDELERLQDIYDKAAQKVDDYERGLIGLGQTEEARNENIEEQRQLMQNAAAAMAPLMAITGEWVTVNREAIVNMDAVNRALFDGVDAAGGSAVALAILGTEMGLYSEEAALAALESALIQQKIDELAAAYADGSIDVATMRQTISDFIVGLEEIRNQETPEVVIETNFEEALDALSATDAKLAEKLGVFTEESQGLSTDAQTAFEEMSEFAGTNMGKVSTSVDEAMLGMATSAATYIPKFTGTVETGMSTALTTAESFVPPFAAVGTNIVSGMVMEVQAGGGSLSAAVERIVLDALAAAEAAAETESPSKRTIRMFHDVVEGMIVGAEDKKGDLIKTMEDIVNGVFGVVGGTLSAGSGFSGLADTFSGMLFDPIFAEFDAVSNRIAEQFGGTMPDLDKNFDELLGYAQSTGNSQLVDDLTEYRKLQEERNAAEERLIELQEKQQQLGFLQAQLSLLETIRQSGLDPASVLSGINLGLDASVEDLLAATEAAMQAMIERADDELGEAQGVAEFAFGAMNDATEEGLDALIELVGQSFSQILDDILGREEEFYSAGEHLSNALSQGWQAGTAGHGSPDDMGGEMDRMGSTVPWGTTMAEMIANQLSAAGVGNVLSPDQIQSMINAVMGGSFGATGLHMTVPSGNPNDSYPIWTSSGERVDVWTAAEAARMSTNATPVMTSADDGRLTVNVFVTSVSGDPYRMGETIANTVADRLGSQIKMRV